jgi:hypothetical protein
MQIVRFYVGDTLEMKKTHPCGEKHFEVLRVGAQVRVRCVGCGRDMVLDRIKLEKAIRRVISASTDTPSDGDGTASEQS